MRQSVAFAALLAALSMPAFAEEKAADEVDINTVRGNPPADHPFGKVKPGMSVEEAVTILGKPTAERAYCTGKHRIPFYFGRDKAYTEYYYKGQGKIYFYSDVSTFSAFHGAVNRCSPKDPTEVEGVEYNVNESGEVPAEAK